MRAGTLEKLIDRIDGMADVIRGGAAESERLGCIAPDVVDVMHEAGLFAILVPEELGGHGLTIPESTEIFRRIAALDASTGWTLAILADGAVFARHLSPEVFATICGDPHGLIAGTLNPAQAQARATADGFVFTGRAGYLSGSAHARWIMATAIVFDGDAPVITDAGIHLRSGIFPIDRGRNLDTWNTTGMRGTGSNDYEFHDVEVASDWTFEPLRPQAGGADVFSWIPLWAQLGPALTAVAVGAAQNMIERFTELATAKVPAGGFNLLSERASAQIALGEAHGLCQAAHALLGDTVRSSWDTGVAHEPFDNPLLARLRLGLVTAVQLSARAIDLLHDAAGMNAVARDSVLDRCWRDVHTMTQHLVLSPARFEVAGRVLLGLDPGTPII
jgi:alkylation response protein AidB-like acyl-CoA dehydrogenase